MNNKGIISLTVVIFMMVIMVVILALLQSRILLGIQRTKGTADSILSTYNAESKIYDTLARFNLGFPIDPSQPEETLSDGTKLKFDTQTTGNEQDITITAKLPFATTKLKMSRSLVSTTSYNGVDILMSLDCTGSMGDCANPDDGTSECQTSSDPSKTTRFQELRKGTVAFLEGLKGLSVPVRVGLSVFSGDANWALNKRDGQQITPDNYVDIDDIIQTVNTNFNTRRPYESTGCKVIPEEGTSHATSMLFMHDYFNNPLHSLPQTKQIEVMVTDGLPTTTIPVPACGSSYFIPNGRSQRCETSMSFAPILNPSDIWSCKPDGGTSYVWGGQGPYATELAKCMITNRGRTWNGTDYGQRNPDIDAYMIATYKLSDTNGFKQFLTSEPGVYYYDTANAQDLTTILKDTVIGQITQSINEFKIQRVVQ